MNKYARFCGRICPWNNLNWNWRVQGLFAQSHVAKGTVFPRKQVETNVPFTRATMFEKVITQRRNNARTLRSSWMFNLSSLWRQERAEPSNVCERRFIVTFPCRVLISLLPTEDHCPSSSSADSIPELRFERAYFICTVYYVRFHSLHMYECTSILPLDFLVNRRLMFLVGIYWTFKSF